MKSDLKFMLQIIADVLGDGRMTMEPENANWQWIYEFSKQHNMSNIIAYPVCGGSINVTDEIKSKFAESLYENIVIDEYQKKDLTTLFAAFEQHNIAYMPIKGIELKILYPSTDMRRMGDADILIKPEQRGEIFGIMNELGYKYELESNHEYLFSKPPFIYVELHKFLIPTYNDDMHPYYGDGWSLAQRQEETSKYLLSPEDHYVYIIAHMAKHYRDSGVGIRMVADIYVYLARYTKLDYSYIDAQLKALNIDKFEKNVKKLIKVWFEGEETTEITEAMTSFICKSGEYGTRTNSVIVRTMRENMEQSFSDIEKKKYINVLFPDIEKMKQKHPILESASFLLPFFWIWRIIKNFVLRWKLLPRAKCDVDSITAESMQKYLDHMKMVGLDVYNGRKRK